MSEEAYVVTLRAEMGKLRQDLKRARQLASESIGTKPIRITVDQAAATREAKRTAKTIRDAVSTAKIKLNIDRDAINRQFAKPLRINAQIVADRASMAGLTKAQRIRMRIDTTTFAADVVRVRSLLTPLTGQSHTVRLLADTSGVTSGVARSRAALASLVAPQLRIRATSDLAPVRADLRRLRQEASQPIDVNMRSRGGAAGGQPGIGGGFYSGAGGRFFGGAGAASFLGGGPLTAIGAGLGASVGGPLGATAGGIVGATAGAGIGMVGEGIDSLGQTQRIEATLQSILKSDQAGTQLLQAVQALRKDAPQLSKAALARSAASLAGAQFDPKIIPDAIAKLSEAAAVSPVPIEEALNRLSVVFGQIKGEEKLTKENLNQITELGIPINRIISEQFGGRNANDVIADTQKGTIDINTALNQILEGFGESFGGTLGKQLESLPGQLAALDASLLDLKETAAGPVIQPLTEAIGEINAMAAAGEFESLGEVLAATSLAAVGAAAELAKLFRGISTGEDADGVLSTIARFVTGKNDTVNGFWQDVFDADDNPTSRINARPIPQSREEAEQLMSDSAMAGDRDIAQSVLDRSDIEKISDSKVKAYLKSIQTRIEFDMPVSEQENTDLQRFKSEQRWPERIPDTFNQPPVNYENFDQPAEPKTSTSAIDEAGQRLADSLNTIADELPALDKTATGSQLPAEPGAPSTTAQTPSEAPNAPQPRRTETASTTTSGPVDVKVTTDVDVSGGDEGPTKPDRPAEIPETVVEAPKVNVTTPEPTVVTVPPKTSTADPADVSPSETLTSYTAPDAIEDLAETLDRPARAPEMDSASIVDAIEENAPPRADGDNRTEAERIADIQTANRADYQQKNADAIREQSKRETDPAVRAALEYEAEKLDYQAKSLRSSIPSPERTGEDRKVEEYAAALEGNQQDRDRRQSNIEFLASAPPEVQAAIANNQIGDEDPVFPSMVPDPQTANPLPSTDEVRQYWYPDEPAPQSAPTEPPQAITPNVAPVDNRTADERAFDEEEFAKRAPLRERAAELRAEVEAMEADANANPVDLKAARYAADEAGFAATFVDNITPSPEFTGDDRKDERERLAADELDKANTTRTRNKWLLQDATPEERDAIAMRAEGKDLAFPRTLEDAQEPTELISPQDLSGSIESREARSAQSRKQAAASQPKGPETLVSTTPPADKPMSDGEAFDKMLDGIIEESTPSQPVAPAEIPQAAAIDDVLTEVVQSAAIASPPEIDNRTDEERAFDARPMSDDEKRAQTDVAMRGRDLAAIEADPTATTAEVVAARYAFDASQEEATARENITPSPELTGEERDAEQKRLVAKETNRQKRLREQNIKKLEQATPEERAAIFAAMPESTEAFPRSIEEGQQIGETALTAPERLENLQADEAAFTAGQQATKQADEQASEAKAKEAKQAERAARVEEQRATIIEADTKAVQLRKQASETEDPAKKKALEYAADAAEFESEQARNMILPEGLTEAEEKEELAKRKAENLRREGDRMVENTREVGMASEAERAAIAEQQIDSRAFPTKAEPEDFYEAEMERGRLNQQAKQVETQGQQSAIGDRNAATDNRFEEIQKTFPEEFSKILDNEIGDNPMLKKAFESVRPKFSQETNENGERVNRVDMDRPDLQRPEPVQYSGVAEIGKLVQGNINKAEASETEKQMLKVMEKMKGALEKIEKKTGEGDGFGRAAPG
ncbi:hypothetical protein [Neorhodopirellula pilleata]|uniref:Uncharacterized protein n=1 Tax=Neorhodopirellula pilleata TaxID=2714738 RepID=A0A5C5ZQ42_9BACT|nr:hypothetical protein [Neorhodopirellula pilleata]TWT89316.1 hypothetical protein Pla100_56330 [Neorhodopirellula pilleata]